MTNPIRKDDGSNQEKVFLPDWLRDSAAGEDSTTQRWLHVNANHSAHLHNKYVNRLLE